MAFLGSTGGGGAGEMAGYLPAKMKRKDLKEILHDEFSEFSLSSPAKKIRRLDAELPPIMEEEEQAVPLVLGQQLPEQLRSSTQPLAAAAAAAASTVKAESPLPSNYERALVLYKAVNVPLLEPPTSATDVFFRVDSDLIAGFKNQAFWSGQRNLVRTGEEEADASMDEKPPVATNNCSAVVPWMPYQLPNVTTDGVPPVPETSGTVVSELLEEPMEEFQEVEISPAAAAMDVEEVGGQAKEAAAIGIGGTEGLQHWQQQHVMMNPQFPPNNTSTPIMW